MKRLTTRSSLALKSLPTSLTFCFSKTEKGAISPTGASPQKTGSTEVMNIPFYSLAALILCYWLLEARGPGFSVSGKHIFGDRTKGSTPTTSVCLFTKHSEKWVSITSIQMCSWDNHSMEYSNLFNLYILSRYLGDFFFNSFQLVLKGWSCSRHREFLPEWPTTVGPNLAVKIVGHQHFLPPTDRKSWPDGVKMVLKLL